MIPSVYGMWVSFDSEHEEKSTDIAIDILRDKLSDVRHRALMIDEFALCWLI